MKHTIQFRFWIIFNVFLVFLMFKFCILIYQYDFLSVQSNYTHEIHFRRFYKNPTLPSLTLSDIYISVKTSKRFESTRLPLILKTWFQLAKNQTWFFTDSENSTQINSSFIQANGHIITTNCSSNHSGRGLVCKMGAEIKLYYESGKKWFCHFDDDNYVNVPRLLAVLREYDYNELWYLGKRSIRYFYWRYTFWFATGGAGFCISQGLTVKMYPLAKEFEKYCHSMNLPDDVCVGFIIMWMTRKSGRGVRLTQVSGFHSHLENLTDISMENLQEQISLSYNSKKTLKIPGFNESYDPTRFMSLHCILFPHFEFC